MQTIHAIGVYGRKPSMEDWLNGRDFQIAGFGRYFSIRDTDILKSNGVWDVKFYDSNLQFLKENTAFSVLL
jgi:hypothetical protein